MHRLLYIMLLFPSKMLSNLMLRFSHSYARYNQKVTNLLN